MAVTVPDWADTLLDLVGTGGTRSTAHSSSTNTGDSAMSTHPAPQQILDRVKNDMTAENERLGSGHGKCAEVSLISDRLHHLDPNGTGIVTAEDVRKAMEGSRVYSVRIGDMRPADDQLLHGEYKPPCRSCEKMLPLAGVIAHH
ncbi:YwqJ-related putative deaminase [Streptomyces sp. NPDC087219]|uniref:YwqJ-related putative deaminase n=1 Tax=Streptomyces sp. NPDC087219 TaxID=3365770 RepID=UPI0038243F89